MRKQLKPKLVNKAEGEDELKPEPTGGDELKRVTLTSSLLPGMILS
jgi:hypothetical protein